MTSSVQELLASDEGRRLWPYTDTYGNLTWGIGHLMANGIATDVEALLNQAVDLQFQHDLDAVTQGLQWLFDQVAMDPVRQAVLIDMAFNLGLTKLQGFGTFIGLVCAAQWQAAATDLRGTMVYRELPGRYERLARMLETGEWPSS